MAMRVGDFYEFYGEDAEAAAATLEITLTGREDGSNGRVSMAGVPFHSVEKYLARLVQAGHKVALCDQVEDPKKAKGLVKREVTRVLTKGTLLEDSMLTPSSNNFLAALCLRDGKAGLATLDPSTGEFLVTEIEGEGVIDRLLQELGRLRPAEVLVGESEQEVGDVARDGLSLVTTSAKPPEPHKATSRLTTHFGVGSLAGFGLDGKSGAVIAASMVLEYASTNGLNLGHVDGLTFYHVDGFMRLDPSTRKSLELTQNIADGSRRFTLLSVLDQTVTSMGARLLRRWVEQPLLDRDQLELRHSSVARLIEHAMTRGDLRDSLKKVADIERLVGRICTGLASPRDLAALRHSLFALLDVDEAFRKVALGHLAALRQQMDLHQDLEWSLRQALVEDPPLTIREGGIFRPGFDVELDKLRDLARNGKDYILALEVRERQETGLDKIKVGYNSVFGYYLELPKNLAGQVPDRYIRKQTTANSERYITAELKEHESAVLGAEEKSTTLEADLFHRLRQRVAEQSKALLQTAKVIAELDVLATLAQVAVLNRYVRPEIVEDDILEIRGGRHPVVEAHTSLFVPNDLSLGDPERLMVLTGPNMSGKSTYLRQIALVVLLAQIGSFVPAVSCRMGLCDRIFTRIGAKDEIALGQSTFMVEMIESANILNNSSPRSLVILDEVGRGTSTFDGLAIAWAMVEHLAECGCKCLFATHYHQMNKIADQLPQVFNCRVAVEEMGDQVVWTHRVLPGGTDRSYGIQVAKMAGVPPSVLGRAQEILGGLEQKDSAPQVETSLRKLQLTLFDVEKPVVVQELEKLDVNKLTPVEALMKLDEWKKSL
jgi:DNA mismatch repair protein MutS